MIASHPSRFLCDSMVTMNAAPESRYHSDTQSTKRGFIGLKYRWHYTISRQISLRVFLCGLHTFTYRLVPPLDSNRSVGGTAQNPIEDSLQLVKRIPVFRLRVALTPPPHSSGDPILLKL